MTEGRKASGLWEESTPLRTIVSGGFSALKPAAIKKNFFKDTVGSRLSEQVMRTPGLSELC